MGMKRTRKPNWISKRRDVTRQESNVDGKKIETKNNNENENRKKERRGSSLFQFHQHPTSAKVAGMRPMKRMPKMAGAGKQEKSHQLVIVDALALSRATAKRRGERREKKKKVWPWNMSPIYSIK